MTSRSNRKAVLLGIAAALLASACASRRAPTATAPQPELLAFEATAYSLEGKTATGGRAQEGICAADPDVLPLGSRIRVHEAGPYSGECVVTDTGRSISGREIDIYIPNDAEAKRFGRKKVKVEILRP